MEVKGCAFFGGSVHVDGYFLPVQLLRSIDVVINVEPWPVVSHEIGSTARKLPAACDRGQNDLWSDLDRRHVEPSFPEHHSAALAGS